MALMVFLSEILLKTATIFLHKKNPYIYTLKFKIKIHFSKHQNWIFFNMKEKLTYKNLTITRIQFIFSKIQKKG